MRKTKKTPKSNESKPASVSLKPSALDAVRGGSDHGLDRDIIRRRW